MADIRGGVDGDSGDAHRIRTARDMTNELQRVIVDFDLHLKQYSST